MTMWFLTAILSAWQAAPAGEPEAPEAPPAQVEGPLQLTPNRTAATALFLQAAPELITLSPATPESLSLHATGSGGYRYIGTEAERFDATIAADGTVTFDVDPSIRLRVDGICLIAICLQRPASQRSPKTPTTSSKAARAGLAALAVATGIVAGALASETQSRMIAANLGRTIYDPTGQPYGAPLFGSVSGRYGYLPEPVRQMTAFMERTFDLRLAMARGAQLTRMNDALVHLPEQLQEIWNDTPGSAADRRAAVFRVWDEMQAPTLRDTVVAEAVEAEDRERREQITERAHRIISRFLSQHPA